MILSKSYRYFNEVGHGLTESIKNDPIVTYFDFENKLLELSTQGKKATVPEITSLSLPHDFSFPTVELDYLYEDIERNFKKIFLKEIYIANFEMGDGSFFTGRLKNVSNRHLKIYSNCLVYIKFYLYSDSGQKILIKVDSKGQVFADDDWGECLFKEFIIYYRRILSVRRN